MSLEELKKVTTCGDCFELGHWEGDPQCKGPKAHEAINVEPPQKPSRSMGTTMRSTITRTTVPMTRLGNGTPWVATQDDSRAGPSGSSSSGGLRPGLYVRQAWKEQKSELYREPNKEEQALPDR